VAVCHCPPATADLAVMLAVNDDAGIPNPKTGLPADSLFDSLTMRRPDTR
jgi:hypothetical protein